MYEKGSAGYETYTTNIKVQVIKQVQLIKSSSVQLNVYEFHTAIDSHFSTKHSIIKSTKHGVNKLEEPLKPLAFSLQSLASNL